MAHHVASGARGQESEEDARLSLEERYPGGINEYVHDCASYEHMLKE